MSEYEKKGKNYSSCGDFSQAVEVKKQNKTKQTPACESRNADYLCESEHFLWIAVVWGTSGHQQDLSLSSRKEAVSRN